MEQEVHLLSTDTTLVCILSHIKSDVIVYPSICPVTYISPTVTPISMKVCKTVDLSSGDKVSLFGGDIFRGHQRQDQKAEGLVFWAFKKPFDHRYLENGKWEWECYVPITA